MWISLPFFLVKTGYASDWCAMYRFLSKNVRTSLRVPCVSVVLYCLLTKNHTVHWNTGVLVLDRLRQCSSLLQIPYNAVPLIKSAHYCTYLELLKALRFYQGFKPVGVPMQCPSLHSTWNCKLCPQIVIKCLSLKQLGKGDSAERCGPRASCVYQRFWKLLSVCVFMTKIFLFQRIFAMCKIQCL
jgi:hypothetical protein